MAITLATSETGSNNDGGTTVFGLNSVIAGDVILVFGVSTGGTAATPTADTGTFTSIITGAAGDGNELQYSAAYMVAPSSANYTITMWDTGNSSQSGAAIAMAFRGVHASTQLDVAPVTQEDTNGSPTIPAITPVSDDCAIVVFGGGNRSDASIGIITNYSTPLTIIGTDDNSCTVGAAYRVLTGGASVEEAPANFSTWNSTGEAAVGITIALRPAAVTAFRRRSGNIPFIAPRMGNSGFKVI